MDFALTEDLKGLRDRVRDFVNREVIPLETRQDCIDEYRNIAPHALERIREMVRSAGLWAPQMPERLGGLGLGMVGMAVCYEEMNRSIFGPVCFNCAAPDDGTMLALEKVLADSQKAKWLQPIVDGRVQSAFAMTEPAPGAGSDPSMMLTRASAWATSGSCTAASGSSRARPARSISF